MTATIAMAMMCASVMMLKETRAEMSVRMALGFSEMTSGSGVVGGEDRRGR